MEYFGNHRDFYDASRECPSCKKTEWIRASSGAVVYQCKFCNNVSNIDRRFTHAQLRAIHNKSMNQLYAGGYGSGKTVLAAFKKLYVAMLLPESLCLITSSTLEQVYDTTAKEIMAITPPKIISINSVSKERGGTIKLINDHEIIFKTPNEQKLRSMNITHAHIEEVNGVEQKVFKQISARLRQSIEESTLVVPTPEELALNELRRKYYNITCTTNPEDSWVTENILLRIPEIDNYSKHIIPEKNSDLFNSGYAMVSDSIMNYMLPKNYISNLYQQLETEEERETYIGGDFNAKAGRVITNVNDLIYTGEIRGYEDLITIHSLDFGAGGANGDPQSYTTAYLSLHQNKDGKHNIHVWFAYNIYSREGFSIEQWCQIYKEHNEKVNSKYVMPIFADNIHGNKSYAYDQRGPGNTIIDRYKKNGLTSIVGGRNGAVNISDRNLILKDMAESGRIHVSIDNKEMINELKNYKRLKIDHKTLAKTGTKPKEKYQGEDHAIDNITTILLEINTIPNEDHKEWFDNALQKYKVARNDDNNMKDFYNKLLNF